MLIVKENHRVKDKLKLWCFIERFFFFINKIRFQYYINCENVVWLCTLTLPLKCSKQILWHLDQALERQSQQSHLWHWDCDGGFYVKVKTYKSGALQTFLDLPSMSASDFITLPSSPILTCWLPHGRNYFLLCWSCKSCTALPFILDASSIYTYFPSSISFHTISQVLDPIFLPRASMSVALWLIDTAFSFSLKLLSVPLIILILFCI